MDERESEWALEGIEQAKRDHKTILALREQLDRARTERDEARVALDAALATATDDLVAAQDEADALRAELARYTAVYGDPDAPVDVAHMFALEAPGAPLTPGLVAMADRVLRGTPISPTAIADAPHIKVGDHVRCESLGNLTGIVETVNPSEVPGWDQCLVRDDREGHVWGAAAWILEVLP